MITLKRLLFYWLSSFVLATCLYYILWNIMPNHYVFGVWLRMICYQYDHPILYIIIPCFFYGILANLFASKLNQTFITKKIAYTFLIIFLTIVISSPFGGMLWQFHDMQAGYFPNNWISILLTDGCSWGLQMGWLIVALSIPYNIIGTIICYFLTQKGINLFKQKEK